jgi:hypothetical protein
MAAFHSTRLSSEDHATGLIFQLADYSLESRVCGRFVTVTELRLCAANAQGVTPLTHGLQAMPGTLRALPFALDSCDFLLYGEWPEWRNGRRQGPEGRSKRSGN